MIPLNSCSKLYKKLRSLTILIKFRILLLAQKSSSSNGGWFWKFFSSRTDWKDSEYTLLSPFGIPKLCEEVEKFPSNESFLTNEVQNYQMFPSRNWFRRAISSVIPEQHPYKQPDSCQCQAVNTTVKHLSLKSHFKKSSLLINSHSFLPQLERHPDS